MKSKYFSRLSACTMYLLYTFSINWVISVIITFFVYIIAKHKKIKFHALQATIFGICVIVFMSIFGFISSLLLNEPKNILNVIGKIIGIIFALLAILVLLKKDIRLKIIEGYV